MSRKLAPYVSYVLSVGLVLSSCTHEPTLLEVAKRRQTEGVSHPAVYITDSDVLEFTDQLKTALQSKFTTARTARYSSATLQATLAALTAGVKTFGWSTGTASGLGLGNGFLLNMRDIFDARGQAQAFQQAYSALQSAESTFYFRQLGNRFTIVEGRTRVIEGDKVGRNDIPSATHLTPDGQTLYYRATKILRVLDDTLSNKIPDLQDLKDAQGESNGFSAPPAKPAGNPTTGTDNGSGGNGGGNGDNPSGGKPGQGVAAPQKVISEQEAVRFTLFDLRTQARSSDQATKAHALEIAAKVAETAGSGVENGAIAALLNFNGSETPGTTAKIAKALDQHEANWRNEIKERHEQNYKMRTYTYGLVKKNDNTTAQAILKSYGLDDVEDSDAAVELRKLSNTLDLTRVDIDKMDNAILAHNTDWIKLY